MAQLVERVLGKDEVTGSNPVSSSIKRNRRFRRFLFFVRTGDQGHHKDARQARYSVASLLTNPVSCSIKRNFCVLAIFWIKVLL